MPTSTAGGGMRRARPAATAAANSGVAPFSIPVSADETCCSANGNMLSGKASHTMPSAAAPERSDRRICRRAAGTSDSVRKPTAMRTNVTPFATAASSPSAMNRNDAPQLQPGRISSSQSTTTARWRVCACGANEYFSSAGPIDFMELLRAPEDPSRASGAAARWTCRRPCTVCTLFPTESVLRKMAAEHGELLDRLRRALQLPGHAERRHAVAQRPRDLGELDRIPGDDPAPALLVANRLEQYVERRLGLLDQIGITPPVGEDAAEHGVVMRRVRLREMHVRGRHGRQRVAAASGGLRDRARERRVQQPEAFGRHAREQRLFPVEVAIQRGARDAKAGADAPERQRVDPFFLDGAHGGLHQRAFQVAVVVGPLLLNRPASRGHYPKDT